MFNKINKDSIVSVLRELKSVRLDVWTLTIKKLIFKSKYALLKTTEFYNLKGLKYMVWNYTLVKLLKKFSGTEGHNQ